MAAIDSTKPSSTYDAAIAQQPRTGPSQGQVQQHQQALQSGVLMPNGGADTQVLSNGATAAQPEQLPVYEQNLPQRGNYNNETPLSNVLPSDGGSGEGALAGGTAAADAWLNNVDFTNSLFALKPLTIQDTAAGASDANASDAGSAAANNTTLANAAALRAKAAAVGSGSDSGFDVDAGFSQGGADSVLAQRLVDAAIQSAEEKASEGGSGIGDPNDPNTAEANVASNNNSPNNAADQAKTSDNAASAKPEDSAAQQTQQGSTTAQQKANDPSGSTQPGGKAADQQRSAGGAAGGERVTDPELSNALNAFLMRQLVQQNPKEKAILSLLRGEEVLNEALETTQTLLDTHGESAMAGGLAGKAGRLAEGAGSLGSAPLGERLGGTALRGEAAILAQGGEQALNNATLQNTRALVMLMSNMPATGTSQPVLAMIAADIFRLQSLRLELMASSRCADEDGEMPPVDEDEAAMKRREVQGIDLSGMWRWDLRPKVDSDVEEEEEEDSAQVWFRTALITCALQRPNLVAPMFQSTVEAHSVRLYEHDEAEGTFNEHWVQIPSTQPALETFTVTSEHFATWVNLAEKAFTHARFGPSPIISEDRSKNAQAQATALQAIIGKPTYALVRDMDEDEAAQRTFFKAVCRSNAPKSLPTIITTREATFADDGLRPSYAYGVLGAFVKDDAWSVILCEDRGPDPQPSDVVPVGSVLQSDKSFRIFAVPYQALHRNAASVVFLPG